MSDPTRFEARRNPRAQMLLLGIIVVGSLALFAIPVPGDAPGFLQRMEFGAKIVGGAGLIFAAWKFRSAKSAPLILTVSDAGVWYRPWSDQTVGWDQVKRVNVVQAGLQKVVCLHLENPDKFTINKRQQLANKANKASGDFGDMNIMVTTTDRSLKELVTALELFKAVETGA